MREEKTMETKQILHLLLYKDGLKSPSKLWETAPLVRTEVIISW